MLGAELVAAGLRKIIVEDLPGQLDLLRARSDIQPGEIPDLISVEQSGVDPTGINQFPVISIEPTDTLGVQQTVTNEANTGYSAYMFKYRYRVYTWVTGADYVRADLLRRRYMLALRVVLLNRTILIPENQFSETANTDPTTLRESYDVGVGQLNKVYLAGGYTQIDVTAQELALIDTTNPPTIKIAGVPVSPENPITDNNPARDGQDMTPHPPQEDPPEGP